MTSLDQDGRPFPDLINDNIIKAAMGLQVDSCPVWIMRQAGRYLPEFREIRKKHSFFDICQTPQLACEVTLMPIKRFPQLDAAIIFSDILVIPQALGMTVQMLPDKGPHFPDPLKIDDKFALDKLDKQVDISKKLSYVYRAITMTRHALEGKCPLIGFAGLPWTLMGYMIEGGGSKTMSNAKKWLYREPDSSHTLLALLASKIAEHLFEQVKAGAQMLQLFESSAEYLNRELFEKFSYPYILDICNQVRKKLRDSNMSMVPIIVFAKGAHYALESLGNCDGHFEVLSIDWTIDPRKARKMTKMTLQGNLDPCCLYASPEAIENAAKNMVASFGSNRYIANLGHGIYPDVDVKSVEAFIKGVKSVS